MPALVRLLRHRNASVVEGAMGTLACLDAPGVTEALVAAFLQGEDRAAVVLARRADPRSAPAICDCLSWNDAARVQLASEILLSLKAVGDLAQVLHGHPSAAARLQALRLLLQLRPVELPMLLAEALDDASEAVRALAERSGAAASHLLDEDALMREAAVRALGRRANRANIPALREAMHDPIARVRAAAVDALFVTAGPEGGRWYEGAMADPSALVRRAGTRALRACEEGFEALVAALEDGDADVRDGAALALGRRGDRDAVPALLDAMDRGQLTALTALGELGDGRALVPLVRALQVPAQRLTALDALARLGDPAAVPMLEAFHRSWRPDPDRPAGTPDAGEVARDTLAAIQRTPRRR